MNATHHNPEEPWQPSVVVVGGGLAGLAAAAALSTAGVRVTVLEARRHVGGRAASFEDSDGGGLVDACQHVAMGCCTNFLDLCRQAGIDRFLRRDRTLWFIGPDGVRAACTPTAWLPAPLHLGPLLLSMRHFDLREKIALVEGMLRLARHRGPEDTALAWLDSAGQPERVVRLFWQPVLESALGESIDLVGTQAARKVAVDAFLAHRSAADLLVPVEPLGKLFGERLVAWLRRRGVEVGVGRSVTAVTRDASGRAVGVVVAADALRADAVIMAVPWRRAARLVPEVVPDADVSLAGSPITAVHLWFDRDCIDVPHAVLVGRVSQWVFRPDDAEQQQPGYCQVVISASRGLMGLDRESLLATVVGELSQVFPAVGSARLLRSRIVTDPTAVLSVRPGVAASRPAASTSVPNLYVAGDWTATGWPSTMEGAVRSGRLAAQAVCRQLGLRVEPLAPDLPKNLLVRLLTGG